MGRVTGIEVKLSHAVQPRDFEGLRCPAQDAGARFAWGVVLYTGESAVPFGLRLWAVTISGWRSNEPKPFRGREAAAL